MKSMGERATGNPEAPRRGVKLCKARGLTVIGVCAVGVARGHARFWRIPGAFLAHSWLIFGVPPSWLHPQWQTGRA